MKLTIAEGNYIEEVINRARELYGDGWERTLRRTELPMPAKGFSELNGAFEEFDTKKEEEVIEQLKLKNIFQVRKHEVDVEREGSFQDKYADSSEYFVGINRNKLDQLKEQLKIPER